MSPLPDRRCSRRTRPARKSASISASSSREGTVGLGVAAVRGADALPLSLVGTALGDEGAAEQIGSALMPAAR